MNRLSFFIVVMVLVTVEGSFAFGQTHDPVSTEQQPYLAEGVPGRPTLQKRRSVLEPSPTDGGRVKQEPSEEENYKHEAIADDSLNSQKPTHIKFEGLQAFSEGDTVKAFDERLPELRKAKMPSADVLAKAVALLKELLEARGYFNATVDTRHDGEAGTIVFLVNEGQHLSLAEVRFEGNRSLSSPELTLKMGECLAKYPMLGGYDASIFDVCSRSLLNSIRSRGYLQATFDQPTRKTGAGGLVLIISVNEGVLYRLGEIKIEGAQAVPSEQVRAMLNLRQGDIARAEEIGKWLFEDLKKTYGEIGYIEYSAEPEPDFKVANGASEGVVDFKVTIEEGQQFRLHAIKIQGSSLPQKELLGLLRIRAGEIFNQKLFEESIEELNKSGRFELIDKDRDTDFRMDEERALIDVVIKIINKGGERHEESSLTRPQA